MSSYDNDFSRRDFLRLAMMSSAMLAASGPAVFAQDSSSANVAAVPGPRTYGALVPLAPGAVQPEGWLRLTLERQAVELGSQLPNVSWPFTDAYWAGKDGVEGSDAWWPWEQKAYWVDGATRLSLVLGDEKLRQQVESTIQYTLNHPAVNGYLGPKFMQPEKDNCSRWPQNVFFRALTANADGEPASEKEIAEALRKHYLNDTAPYGIPVRNVSNIEAMLWTYQRTGDATLLGKAEEAWTEYLTVAGESGRGDLSEDRVYSAMPIECHGVTYAELSKLPAILYLHTGKSEYLKFAHAAQRRIFDHHMLIDGIPSTHEWFEAKTALDTHETCDISDHTWSWGYMMMAEGDGVWGDRIERAFFNAGPGAIKNDWKGLQYFSGPNQFLATLDSDHNAKTRGSRQMAYQPNPGQKTACCGGNVHRLLPNYVIRMWMKDAQNGLRATLYGPSRVKAAVGAENETVEIIQTTDYPFNDQIKFTINTERPVKFPLSLRIPEWCKSPKVAVNDAKVDIKKIDNGFVTLDRKFKPGDTVTLTLPMETAVSQWPQNGIGVERGPLVYSLAIKENWTSLVEPEYTTAAFPSWNAQPASAWNYGLALKPGNLDRQIQVASKPVEGNPWDNPPVSLTVPARRIEDWELQVNPEKPSQKFTPPLPEISRSQVSTTTETLTLVPYGSTQLRVTIFPALEPQEG